MTQQEQDELRELQKKLFDSRITLGDIEVRMSHRYIPYSVPVWIR